MTRRDQRQKHAQLREVARAICHATTRDCVMNTSPDRPPCDDRNCAIYPIAREAIRRARARLDPPAPFDNQSPFNDPDKQRPGSL